MSGAGQIRDRDQTGAVTLRSLQHLAESFGDATIARDAATLARRVESSRIYVACVGQFKRGKSTLIDALVGEHILPVGILPVTAVPTIVRYGLTRQALVHFHDGTARAVPADEVAAYVSQDSNPNNEKHVEAVEVFVPSPRLSGGMCLVDTPGLGSVFEANSRAARAFVPQIDVALVVLGADPPLTGAELDLVAQITEQVRDVLLVLNKADRNSDAELRTVAEFAGNTLQSRTRIAPGPIYQVSALCQWEGKPAWRDWEALTAALDELSGQANRIQRATLERGVKRISNTLLAAIDEEIAALRRPLDETAERVRRLREFVAQVTRSLGDLGALLKAEQAGLARRLADRKRQFLAEHRDAAAADLAVALRGLPRAGGPSYRRGAFRLAQQVAQKHLLPWLAREQTAVEREYADAMRRFVQLADDFIQGAGGGVGLPPEGFWVEHSTFHFYDFITRAQPASPLRYAHDCTLGWVGAYGAISRDAFNFLHLLLDTNAARVESDFADRLHGSRSRLEAEIRARLQALTEASERTLQRATAAQQAGHVATSAALARLAELRNQVESLAGGC